MLQQLQRRVKSGAWKVDLSNADAVDAALRVARAFQDALVAYKAEPIRVRSMIIATAKRWISSDIVRAVFGPQVEIHMMTVEHLEMMSPNNRELAEAVRACVAQTAHAAERYQALIRSKRGQSPVRAAVRPSSAAARGRA